MKKAKIKFLLPIFFLLVSIFSVSLILPNSISARGQSPVGGSCRSNGECESGICKEGTCRASDNADNGVGTQDVNINLSEKLVLDDGRTVQDAYSTPSDMVNLIVRVVFIASGIILFALVVGAGFTLISGGNGQNLDKAKTTLTGAIAGFIIMFAAYWIMQILSMVTGANIGF